MSIKENQIETVSLIETALAKENITNQVIAKLKSDYSGLKINGIEDKEGFKKVEEGRKEAIELAEKAKQEAIDLENKRIEAEKKKAAKAPDKEKMTKWIDDLSLPFIELKQNESNIMASDIKVKFDAFKNWAKKQIETI